MSPTDVAAGGRGSAGSGIRVDRWKEGFLPLRRNHPSGDGQATAPEIGVRDRVR
jgi:hypothetical protein